MTKVVILGGGFGGLYAALKFERALGRDVDLDVTLVNHENFILFTPMLHEVASSDLDVTHIVNPIRRHLRKVKFFDGEVTSIDLDARRVHLRHGIRANHEHQLIWDHLIISLGSVTSFYGTPGVEGNAFTMKSLGDAIALRNRLIEQLEEADFDCSKDERSELLTVIVAGGGFAGVETAAGVNDFLREAVRFYPRLGEHQIRLVLVHAGPVILPELDEKLGKYAERQLTRRGVEVRTGVRLASYKDDVAELSDGFRIGAMTLVWTAGTAPHPLVNALPCEKDRGRIVVDKFLSVPGREGVWAIGDCASVPDLKTRAKHPPTAQHALREGGTVARNILAEIRGRSKKPFSFSTLGQLAAIGRRTGVANILGVNFSGFVAWWLWRMIYLSKLPGFDRKVRVALDWTLDVLLPKVLVQLPTVRTREGDSVALPAAKEGFLPKRKTR